MTELNKTESNQNQAQQKTPAAPPAQSIKQFNHLFNKAANTVRKAEEQPNDTLKKIKFTHSNNPLSQNKQNKKSSFLKMNNSSVIFLTIWAFKTFSKSNKSS